MTNEIFNSHLSGYEREMAIREAEYDTLFAKATMMLEMVDMQLEQNIREAELKVFKEGGTYDDYEYLVQEADEQAGEQKKGVFATIIEAIRSLFQKIGDAISRLFNIDKDVSDDTVVQCDEQLSAANSFINEVWGPLKQFAIGGVFGGVAEAIKKIVAGDIMTVLEKPHNKLVNFTVGKLKIMRENLTKIYQDGNSLCDKMKEKLNSDPKAYDNNGEQVEDKSGKKHPILDMFFDAMKKFLGFIWNIIKKYIVNPLKKIGAKNVDDGPENDESKGENNSENQNTENNVDNANNDNQQQNTEDNNDNSKDTKLTTKDQKSVRNFIRDYKKNNKNAKQPPDDETLKTMTIGGYDSSSPKFNAAMDYFKSQFAMTTDLDNVEERVSLDDFLDDINNDLITESESSNLMEIQSLLEEIL